MVLGSLATVMHGLTSILPSQAFNAEECLKAIQKEKCTTLYGTPTMFIDLYNHPNFSKYDMSSLNSGKILYLYCDNSNLLALIFVSN
jgi:acyl-CoA synthetase (AMP-forming)/AMP-acid ligase II